MPRRIIGSVVGALAAASLVAPVAHAGKPARVTVRVESLTRTLVSTTVTTTRRAVVKDGTHSCTGTSAAGALELAAGDRWSGTWFDGLGYTLDGVDGVRPAGFDYWTLWLNGKMATVGLCDAELEAGDEVLAYICHDAQPPDYSCGNRPLELRVVRTRGGKAEVEVVSLKDDGSSVPVAGATVAGGERPVRTGADGGAAVTLRAGQSALRATHAGDVPSSELHCHRGDRGAGCGSRDRTPPTLKLTGIANGQTFGAAQAPRLLRGVASDPAGATVALRLTRRLGGRCAAYHENREAFRRCGRRPRAPFAVGDRSRWSFLLPHKLGAGSYRLDVIATDGAGNRRVLHVGFTVEA